jgi:hypothetical protein
LAQSLQSIKVLLKILICTPAHLNRQIDSTGAVWRPHILGHVVPRIMNHALEKSHKKKPVITSEALVPSHLGSVPFSVP